MNTESLNVEPGDWYINTNNNERVAVIALEDWGYLVANLQYEDGVFWDEILVDGDLPEPYEPLPASSSDAPTLASACPDDEHVFDVDPQKSGHDYAFCKECRLSMDVLIEFSSDMYEVQKRVPKICHLCEDTLEVGDDRWFIGDIYLCSSCYEERWNEYAGVPYSETNGGLLICNNSPIIPSHPHEDTEPCGFWMQGTIERTEKFLSPPSVQSEDEPKGCPECGGHLKFHRRTDSVVEHLTAVMGYDLVDEPGVDEFVEVVGEDSGVLTSEQVDEFAARVEKEREEARARRRKESIERTREESVFETLPTGQLIEVTGKPASILRNHEPGCQVIGWPSFEEMRVGAAMGFLPSSDVEESGLSREEHRPNYLVVQTREGDQPTQTAVEKLSDLGYTPLDGETGPDRGGGGWPIESQPGHEDSPLLGAFAFIHVPEDE